MISIKTIREKPQSVQDILDLKGYEGSISKIHSWMRIIEQSIKN